jgi:hypothetical protein
MVMAQPSVLNAAAVSALTTASRGSAACSSACSVRVTSSSFTSTDSSPSRVKPLNSADDSSENDTLVAARPPATAPCCCDRLATAASSACAFMPTPGVKMAAAAADEAFVG